MIVPSKLSPVAHNNDLNKHMEEPPATFVYISPDQNQCRRVLNYVCCLWSVRTPLLSRREQSIEGARPPFGIGSGASASWPRPHSVRRINHVYLSTYFSQTSSVAWHWLAGVFCLSLSQSRPTIESLHPPPPTIQDAACGEERTPKTPTSSEHIDGSSLCRCHHTWAGLWALI